MMEEQTMETTPAVEEPAAPPEEKPVQATADAAEKVRLQAVIAARENRILELEASLAQLVHQSAEKDIRRKEAVNAYAQLAVKASPGILPELVTGETVEEVDDSLSRARAFVERVRLELEAETNRETVPAGAPPRVRADLGSLTAAEKIRYAVSRDLHS